MCFLSLLVSTMTPTSARSTRQLPVAMNGHPALDALKAIHAQQLHDQIEVRSTEPLKEVAGLLPALSLGRSTLGITVEWFPPIVDGVTCPAWSFL